MNTKATKLTEVLEDIDGGGDDENLTLGDVVSSIESRGFGPLLMVPCLIVLLPTGAIPTVPTMCGMLIFLIALQQVIGKDHPWLPERVKKVTFSHKMYHKGLEKVRPVTRWIDRWTKTRLAFLTKDPFERIIALWCMGLALTLIPLELVPLAGDIPALAVLFIALGLSARDGLFTAIGLAISAGLIFAAPWLYQAITSN